MVRSQRGYIGHHGDNMGLDAPLANQEDGDLRMPLLWRDGLSVGNNVIDSDHKFLIELINKAEQCLRMKSRIQLFEMLGSLRSYGYEHFSREEMIAGAAGFPVAEHLHASHAHLMEQLEKNRREIEEMKEWSPEAIDHFTNLLRSWLIDHVIREDLQMRPYLVKLPATFDPRLPKY